ncbi:5'-nucleotidase C-terminal domain-containing protein [Croceibacterium sp. TMG7-5b_MA50]|uniref:bifunctional metallophosphatase/5'-nucleotidase n=1 Tax=Croceibacterium sp. TMG7-5b_MA50 TaxID=3121290 RepID=UPI003221FE67
MIRRLAPLSLLALSACATLPTTSSGELQILAINDFHGNLEVPAQPTTWYGTPANVPSGQQSAILGGAARLGAQLASMREGHASSITVAAGDLISASPLISSYYLDEPSIAALSQMGLDLAAVGNHEFDRGTAELTRLQQGGCGQNTPKQPCALEPFSGASFQYLAANVLDEAGNTLFPGTAVKQFGDVTVGFIGMTLKETAQVSSPAGTAGWRFAEEAETANRLAGELQAEGADLIVLLLHQGGAVDGMFRADDCPGLDGAVVPIMERLSPAIPLVVSGHTHNAYVCRVPQAGGGERLLTSAGRYGNFVTDIRAARDDNGRWTFNALNVPVTGAAGEQQGIAALVSRYAAATSGVSNRVVGQIAGSLERGTQIDGPLGRLVADAQLAATRAQGARIAFINQGGVRTTFTPAADGSVTFGQLYALQPFGNTLEVVELSGADLLRLLEEQFQVGQDGGTMLFPSRGFAFAFDPSRPVGSRITSATLDGQPLAPGGTYRVTVNNFLASGGDGFTVLKGGTNVGHGGVDLDALVAFITGGVSVDPAARITRVGAL